jgi:hypothetical protein
MLLGFFAVAIADVGLAWQRMPLARLPSIRVFHHLYASGYTLLLGLLVGLAFSFLRRAPKRALALSSVILFVASGVLAFFGLETDLIAFSIPWRVLFSAIAGLAVPVLWILHSLLGHRIAMCALFLIAAGAITYFNHRVLLTNYPGAHVGMKLVAGAAAGLALTAIPVSRRFRTGIHLSEAIACVLSVAAVVVTPSPSVSVRLSMDESAALYTFVSPLYTDVEEGTVHAEWAGGEAWFRSRKDAPAVKPSSPLLQREDLIVLLITVDAFRHSVFVDPEQQKSIPAIMDLARRSIVFENAHAVSSSTLASLPSIFTGRYLSQMRWMLGNLRGKKAYFLTQEKGVRFPTLLGENEVDTFFVPTTDNLRQKYGWVQGFARQVEQPAKFAGYVNARSAVPRLLRLLPKEPGKRHFGFVHLLDAHAPYTAPGDTPFEKFLGDLSTADAAVGSLLQAIKDRGLEDKTIVIISADHGEAFGEHNQWLHTGKIYEELVRVPTLVFVPGAKPKVIKEPVSIIDLGPTISISLASTRRGRSWAKVLFR